MEYHLVPGRSQVKVTAKATLHSVSARSTRIEGSFTAVVDDDGRVTGPVAGEAQVALRSFRSGNPLLDANTLRYLGVRRHPQARFTIADASNAGGDVVAVTGKLEMAGGVVDLEARPLLTVEGDTLHLSGTWTLHQPALGLRPPRLAMLKVEDDLHVEFRLVAGPAE